MIERFCWQLIILGSDIKKDFTKNKHKIQIYLLCVSLPRMNTRYKILRYR